MAKLGDTIYYRDETEEHSGFDRKKLTIDDRYRYLHKSPLWHMAAFLVNRVMMTPIAFLHTKLKYHHKIVGAKALRTTRGAFLYGNHTMYAADAFIPHMLTFPRRTQLLVGSENLSVYGTRTFLALNGAMPLPTTYRALPNLKGAIHTHLKNGRVIGIYPEAHIWPYYTGIRPFSETAFAFPVEEGAPVFCFTNTFHKRKVGRLPKVVTYVDGPFYPDPSLSKREQIKALAAKVQSVMKERAALSTYTPITYLHEENQ